MAQQERRLALVTGASVAANAGRGLGNAFLDQKFERIRRIIDTNVTGTLYLIHEVAPAMRARGSGRILITGKVGTKKQPAAEVARLGFEAT